MRISGDMIHEDLRALAPGLKLFNFFLSRKWGLRLLLVFSRLSRGRKIKGLHCEERCIKSRNGGPDIRIRIYKPEHCPEQLPAMLYCHGGGYAIGCPEQYHKLLRNFIGRRPCIVVAPDYRKSPEAPFPAAFNDCYDTLIWLKTNAGDLGASADRIILSGHSAGGGLTASLALKARDTREVNIAFQMPLYPMLDDRQVTESSRFCNTPVWDAKTNALAWHWYLSKFNGQDTEIPVYASPARNEDYSDLPPTITFVGSLEPFRDETVRYVAALKKENIPVRFRIFEGCFHAFDQVGSRSAISSDAINFTYESFALFYDRYCRD